MPDTNTINAQVAKNKNQLQYSELEKRNIYLEKLIIQKEEELTEIVSNHNRFISILAHDMRSPICSISVLLEVLKINIDNFNINDIKKYIELAFSSTNRTIKLLDDLFAWNASQNKENSFNPVKINLHELLNDEIESFKTSATQKQINLNYSITAGKKVTGDIQMVKSIVRNLISNAVKFTNCGGEICIYASEGNQFVEIVVKDNGVGISKETQKYLFKPNTFYTSAGTNKETGTGFGLMLCKELVELHGGQIWIESKSGKGSECKFTLPYYL